MGKKTNEISEHALSLTAKVITPRTVKIFNTRLLTMEKKYFWCIRVGHQIKFYDHKNVLLYTCKGSSSLFKFVWKVFDTQNDLVLTSKNEILTNSIRTIQIIEGETIVVRDKICFNGILPYRKQTVTGYKDVFRIKHSIRYGYTTILNNNEEIVMKIFWKTSTDIEVYLEFPEIMVVAMYLASCNNEM